MPDTEGSQIGPGFDVMVDEPAAEDANDVLRDVGKAKTDVAAAPIRAILRYDRWMTITRSPQNRDCGSGASPIATFRMTMSSMPAMFGRLVQTQVRRINPRIKELLPRSGIERQRRHR